jgi:hypothetical protein
MNMSLNSTESKYVNMHLADLLEEALSYKRLSITVSKHPKQRAVYKVLAEAYAMTYNKAVQKIGSLGTSGQSQERALIYPQRINPMTEAEIEELIQRAYALDSKERKELDENLNKNLAKAQVIGSKYPKKIQAALKALAEAGALESFIDTEKLLNTRQSNYPDLSNMPRGNPKKGGLVNKYRIKGYDPEKANQLADAEIIHDEFIKAQAEPKPETRIDMDAKEEGGMSIREAMAILETQEQPAKANPLDILTMSDSDFDSPELAETNIKVEVSEGDRLLDLLEE